MKSLPLLLSLVLAWAPCSAGAAQPTAARTEVMIVGLFHLANPNRDLHNIASPDVLADKPQRDLDRVAASLARFHPSQIAVEGASQSVADRYTEFLAGRLPVSRGEVVQLGFRLAKRTGAGVHGIDVPGDFPFEPVQAWAAAHHLEAELKQLDDDVVDELGGLQSRLDQGGIIPALRYVNDPKRLAGDNRFYRGTLKFGSGGEQPGAELLAAWYRRNLLICANLVQLAKPGDRIVVFYGSGHAFLLRQCVAESPGFRLVEAETYLPN